MISPQRQARIQDENYKVRRALSLLQPYDVTCGKARVGGRNDGGYVMAHGFQNCPVAYSIGVGPQVEWDLEMASYGATVHQYDHTVESAPSTHPSFHFNKLGIGPDMENPELITLEEMLRRNGDRDRSGMILQMDVEGAEWDVLASLGSDLLGIFDQINIEFHWLSKLAEPAFRGKAEAIWSKLLQTHRPIHVHGNNCGNFNLVKGVPLPDIIEVSYCHRSRFDFAPCSSVFPTELDFPNGPDKPDYFLGSFRFL